MKFALLIYGDEKAWEKASEAEQAKMYAGHEAFGKWLAETGWARGGEELHSSQQAKTVRSTEGESVVADGPFAETKVPYRLSFGVRGVKPRFPCA